MKAITRLFGEIDIEDEKIITLEKGIIGFPNLNHFTLIYDKNKESEKNTSLMWFQSMDEPQFAMPVIIPNNIFPDYNPMVNDDMLSGLGELTPDNIYCLVTIKVPKDITQMTVNLKAPIIINTDTLKGAQVVAEDDDLSVREPVYEILKAAKDKAERTGE